MIEHNIELRRHVERIVRPIRGSAHRKMRMREELLVHLTSIFDEELVARDGDVTAATAAAIARFGDPAALRVDLQATVPAVERVMCAQIFPGNTRLGRRPGESVPAFLRRVGPWSFGVNAAVWILFGVFIIFVSSRRPERNAGMSPNVFLVFCAANVVLYPLYAFGSELLGDAAARQWATMPSVEPRDRQRVRLSIAAKIVAIVATRTTLILPCLLLLRGIGVYPFSSGFWLSCVTVGWAAFNVPAALAAIAAIDRWNRWDGLALEEADISPAVVGKGGMT